MSNIVQSVEIFQGQADLEDLIVAELKDALASLSVGSGVRAKLAPGTSVRIKRLTRRLNRLLAPSRFTARIRSETLYVERIA